ncbi:MAG: ABC transporter ATP-binding protein, partial [Ilumatobacteraceae bacterium]
LFTHLRVEQNIAFGLRHLARAARSQRVAELLDMVRLGDVARRYPHELSGGEQQRIALARALAPDPAIVLLDEPFASLDETLRDDVRNDVVAALARQRTPAVLVTHDRAEALTLGHRVAVMRAGRVLQCGEPTEVYERPVDRFVASFLATTSFIAEPDGSVLVARPHDITLVPGGSAIVVDHAYLGATHRYTARRPDGTEFVADHASPMFAIGDSCEPTLTADHPLHRLS